MERAILVTVDLGSKEGWTAEERALELKELALSAGAKVVNEIIARRHEPSPACFIGKGKAEEIAMMRQETRAGMVIFNNGKEVDRIIGAYPEPELRKKIDIALSNI